MIRWKHEHLSEPASDSIRQLRTIIIASFANAERWNWNWPRGSTPQLVRES
jgi:hypothetical protein